MVSIRDERKAGKALQGIDDNGFRMGQEDWPDGRLLCQIPIEHFGSLVLWAMGLGSGPWVRPGQVRSDQIRSDCGLVRPAPSLSQRLDSFQVGN